MSLERLPRTPKNEPGDQTRFGESSSSSPASTDAATFVHNEYPEHAEHGPPIDNALQHNRTASWYQEHGPPIDNALHHDEYEEDYKHHNKLLWSRIRHQIRDPMAEFMGCFILIIFGDGSVAQVVLSGNPNLPKADQSKGDYQSISWGWGIGVMFGVYVAGCAGGHLNPAVTFASCLFRKFPWRKWPAYACAQVSGCFCGAAVVYGNYKSAIDAFEGGPNIRTVSGPHATAGVFCTYPQPFMTKTGQFFSEFIASSVLMFMIFALKDDSNLGAGNLTPLMLFFVIFGIGATLGWETGYAINLARDFGPRLFTYFVGYGHEVWSAGNYYFWVPMIAPFCGCTFGAWLYDVLIFTGESPVNTPWMGMKRVVRPDWKAVKKELSWYPDQEKEV